MFICYMQEIKFLDRLQTSLAKVTGATDKQIVVHIGGKRHLCIYANIRHYILTLN